MTIIMMITLFSETKVDIVLNHLESSLSEVIPNNNNVSSAREIPFLNIFDRFVRFVVLNDNPFVL